MHTSPGLNYDARSLDFFESEVLPRADLVYRFGIAITGSRDKALSLVQSTFQLVTKDFVKFIRIKEFNFTGYLLAECWRIYSTTWKQPSYDGLGDDTQKLVGRLSLDSRVCLYAVDVAGLSPGDAAKAFGTTEKDIRMKLASARRELLAQGEAF